jgi:hypothetical protein
LLRKRGRANRGDALRMIVEGFEAIALRVGEKPPEIVNTVRK